MQVPRKKVEAYRVDDFSYLEDDIVQNNQETESRREQTEAFALGVLLGVLTTCLLGAIFSFLFSSLFL